MQKKILITTSKTKTMLFLLLMVCLFIGCSDDEKEPIRTKSPYISNFVGKYSITENYIWTRVIGLDENNEPIIDTAETITSYYTLKIEETKQNCFDIQFDATDAYKFDEPIQATIVNDSTFFFHQRIPAYNSWGYIQGSGVVNFTYEPPYHICNININYIKTGPSQHGEHNYYSTGIRQ